LPQPLQTWLTNSLLVQTSDLSCVLIVDHTTFELINHLDYLSQIYPIAKTMYEDITSLYVSTNSFAEFVKNGKLDVYSIEALRDH
jgi:hypothetical protein